MGVDYGERVARAYNKGLGAQLLEGIRGSVPMKLQGLVFYIQSSG
jgi:hypothetical protein